MLIQAERLREKFSLARAYWINEIVSRAEGHWQAARDFSERGLAVSSVDPLLVSTRVQLECEAGNFQQSKSFLERCL